MAIRRISDLPKFSYSKYAVTANNLAGTDELKYSQIEISHNENGAEHSQFTSRRMDFVDLSGYITHNLYDESIVFKGNKKFQNKVAFENGIEIARNGLSSNGPVYLDGTVLDGKFSRSITLTAQTVDISSSSIMYFKSSRAPIWLSSNAPVRITGYTVGLSSGYNNIGLTSGVDIDFVAARNNNVFLTNETASWQIVRGAVNGWTSKDVIVSIDAQNRLNCKNDIVGVALSARWADLAEIYESDELYTEGTLVKFGGSKEITIADNDVNAVITSKPGLILNGKTSEQKDKKFCGIALTGRTPVKILGEVHKFDKIMLSNIPGFAQKWIPETNAKVIGIALADKYSSSVELVECVVKMQF